MDKTALKAELKKLLFGKEKDKFIAVTLDDGTVINAEPAFELGAVVTTGEEAVPLANGDYVSNEGTMITIEGGIIVAFEEASGEAETEEELLNAVAKLLEAGEAKMEKMQKEITEQNKVIAGMKQTQKKMFTLVEKMSVEPDGEAEQKRKGTMFAKKGNKDKFNLLVERLNDLKKAKAA